MQKIFSEKRKAKAVKTVKSVGGKLLVFVLLVGLSYVILYPFIFKLLAAFMSKDDLYNSLVEIVPMHWSFENIKYIMSETDFFDSLKNSGIYALLDAALATASAAVVGYGIAKFKFKGINVLTVIVIIVMLMPIQTLSIPLYLNFRFFNPLGIFSLFGSKGIKLVGSVWPMIIMAATSLGFRSGVFVILMRQYYKGVPNELLEAAWVDGAGPYKTFFSIVVPMATSMFVVIFSLSFAWQWTDTFYSNLLYGDVKLLPSLVEMMKNIKLE
ncbi:MAG: carbohydrate ABC transporter permease, partial [Clostridia bacterium]|nr:carbohydrate ABC transporter permease [Clostridia bacterium]